MDIYQKLIEHVILSLTDELSEMYGEGRPEDEARIKDFLVSKKDSFMEEMNEMNQSGELFEQIHIAASTVAWTYLSDFLEEIEETA